MEPEEKPTVMFISCSQTSADNIIKDFAGEHLGTATDLENGMTMYPWTLDTKYYTTDLLLCSVKLKNLEVLKLINTAQGAVIYFDCSSENSLKEVTEWASIIDHIKPEVKLLLSDCGTPNEFLIKKAQEFCLKSGFELVGINEDDDDCNCTGLQRVKQALSAHVWPNLTMKNRKEPTSISDLLNGGNLSSIPNEFEEEGEPLSPSFSDLLEEEVGDDFTALFSRLALMKEKASAMPSDQRKRFAEKVVYAYWDAMGGDPEDL